MRFAHCSLKERLDVLSVVSLDSDKIGMSFRPSMIGLAMKTNPYWI